MLPGQMLPGQMLHGQKSSIFKTGLQKDKYHGTSGTKEGLSSIGRFRQ